MTASYCRLDITRPDSRGYGLSTSRTGTADLRRLLNEIEAGVDGAHSITSVVARESLVAASGTITLSTCAAGTVIRVNGVPFTALSGTPNTANGEFDISGNDTADATSLAAAINASTNTAISGVVTATSSLGVVTVTSTRLGYTANAITLSLDGVVGKATVTAATPVATDTVTINGVTLTARKEMARGTVTCSSVQAGDTVTVNGYVFTAVSGTAAAQQFDMSVSDTATATNLATAINAETHLAAVLSASDDGAGVCKLRYLTSGTAGNAVTLATSNNTRLAKSGTTLSGGQATSATTFDYGDTNAQAATDLARCINAATNSLIANNVRALANAAVVTVYSVIPGVAGNMHTLASSGSTLAVSAARLAGASQASWEGAVASGTFTISSGNGTITAVINGVSFAVTWATDDATTGGLLADKINKTSNGNAITKGVVVATDNGDGTVTVQAVRGGIQGNNITTTASGTGHTVGGARLSGGAAPTAVVLSGARLSGGSAGSPVTFTL